MTMESQRAAWCGALMAPTGEMKNVDRNEDDRKERLAKLIRDNVKPIQPRSAFDVLAILARLDAERLKLIGDVFVAMEPFAAPQRDKRSKRESAAKATKSAELPRSVGAMFTYVINALESQGIRLQFPDEEIQKSPAKQAAKKIKTAPAQAADEQSGPNRKSGRGVVNVPPESESAERLIAELTNIQVACARAARTAEDASLAIEQIVIEPEHTPRRRRRKRSAKPANVIPFRRPVKKITGAQQGDGPKAAS